MNAKPVGDDDLFLLFPTEESNRNLETQFPNPDPKGPIYDENKPKPASFRQVFRFSDRTDNLLLFAGITTAAIVGGAGPLFNLLFGTISDEFRNDKDTILTAVSRVALYLFLIGIGVFIFGAISQLCWIISGERQTLKYRAACLKSLLTQNLAWYDRTNQNELTSKIELEIAKIHDAIGEKISNFIF